MLLGSFAWLERIWNSGKAGHSGSQSRDAADTVRRVMTPPVPEGTTELGIDIIKVERIAAALKKHGDRFPRRVLTENEQRYVRNRPTELRRPLGGQGGRVQGPGPGRSWRRLDGDRDPPAADRRAVSEAPRSRRAARRAAGHGPHRRLDQPRGRLRRGDRLRHPHRRVARSCFRPTSRSGSTSASARSSRACERLRELDAES